MRTKTITIQATPFQAAFLKWMELHPFCRVKELKIHDGEPMEVIIRTDDKFGEEVVRFDRIAKESGLLKE